MTENDKLLTQFRKDLTKQGFGKTRQIKNGNGIVNITFFGLYLKSKKGKKSDIYDHRYFAIMDNNDMFNGTDNKLCIQVFMRQECSNAPRAIKRIRAMDFVYSFYVYDEIMKNLLSGKELKQSRYNYYFDSFIPSNTDLLDFEWDLWHS